MKKGVFLMSVLGVLFFVQSCETKKENADTTKEEVIQNDTIQVKETVGNPTDVKADPGTFQIKPLKYGYDELNEYIDAKTPITHKCKICGYEWLVKPNHTLCGHSCPKCNQSIGERTISQWLFDNNIYFIPQYSFDECMDKLSLPFDFYLPDYNTCIEYDGEQQYDFQPQVNKQ